MEIRLSMLLLGLGTVMFWSGFKKIKRKRMMESTATSKISSLAVGFSEIKGRTREKEIVTSPFSNTPCVYYKFLVDEHDRNWKDRKKGSSNNYFYLEDETGRVEISPKNAEIDLPVSYELRLDKVKEITQ